ncbi:type II toxin-antitoxin system VapC family toxin [Sphingomonas naphthae]|uniref:Type II toxin-antitoxin system VapC family toxin n=1 Tax=Sphingomonas naphthae TaxID=1813468 RepID=A0ABY7TTG2_9SPHN|nr:type II toxin-antitoxin system VapC family toxin [Sphingomonas naphthae]WCT75159.1 type II toxin-antitoxin system VapC family toxin [Sphingomonas naphthae]
MNLLIDTHVLIWAVADQGRLSQTARAALADPDSRLHVSAVTAWEFADLTVRGRLQRTVGFDVLEDRLGLVVLDLPAGLWRIAEALPPIHGDPVDRMLIAHARQSGFTLLTADRMIPRYPVETLW